MRKIVIISSSPRIGGNSDLLCDEFARGAQEAGHQVTKISLANLTIGFCRGCYACQKTHTCITSDDAPRVLAQMLSADVIVLASPVYFYSISAQLKALMDRSFANYGLLTNKTYYFVLTMEDTNPAGFEGPLKAMQGFLDCYEGSTLKGKVCALGVSQKGAVKSTPFMHEAFELGRHVN